MCLSVLCSAARLFDGFVRLAPTEITLPGENLYLARWTDNANSPGINACCDLACANCLNHTCALFFRSLLVWVAVLICIGLVLLAMVLCSIPLLRWLCSARVMSQGLQISEKHGIKVDVQFLRDLSANLPNFTSASIDTGNGTAIDDFLWTDVSRASTR